jgi:hypothetical protein
VRRGISFLAVTAMAMAGALSIRLDAQSITVGQTADAMIVHAPGLGFIKGEPLGRLKDGRTLRVDLDLTVMPGPGGTPVVRGRHIFAVSYDLWEERFAVTMAGTPPKSVAYLTAAAAETWCVEQMTVPIASLGRLGRDAPLWIRLEYRVLDGESTPADGENALSLRSLIDVFSKRPRASEWTHAIEAGPFRLRP